MVDDAKLAEIEARAKAATPGPWRWRDEYRDEDDGDTGSVVRVLEAPNVPMAPPYNVLAHRTYWRIRESNLEFIAHAREDVPALLARMRELEQLEEGVNRALAVGELSPLHWDAILRSVNEAGVPSAASGEERNG